MSPGSTDIVIAKDIEKMLKKISGYDFLCLFNTLLVGFMGWVVFFHVKESPADKAWENKELMVNMFSTAAFSPILSIRRQPKCVMDN
jgi:hypothetical protein